MTIARSTEGTVRVKPSTRQGRATPPAIPLHALDLLMPPLYIRLHAVYHSCPEEINLIEELSSSLAQALELYPPVAGSIKPLKDGKLAIHCDAVGADLAYEMRPKSYAQLAAEDEDGLAPRGVLALPGDDGTLLAIKVTKFVCGTTVVALSIHHFVCDCTGFLDFVRCWAQISRGEPIGRISVPDSWSRTPFAFFPPVDSLPPSVPGFCVLPEAPEGPPNPPPRADQLEMIISADMQRALKEACTPAPDQNGGKDEWVSTGDALAALLWRALIRARLRAGVEVPQDVELSTAVDGRDRSPGKKMVSQYFGNFNTAVTMSLSKDSLMESPLSHVALSIRHALRDQLTADSLAPKLAFLESTQPVSRLVPTNNVMLSNWGKYKFTSPELDFGWGAPKTATGGSVRFPPGAMHVMGCSQGMLATIAVEEGAGKYLMEDCELRKYVEVCSSDRHCRTE